MPHSKHSHHKKRHRKRVELRQRSILFCALAAVICITLVLFFNNSYGRLPALGKFLSPHLGVWQNSLIDNKIRDSILVETNDHLLAHEILIDTAGTAHIFASRPADAYFLQGYIHARDRLWQMDFNARRAAGRLAEVWGERYLEADKHIRKMGITQMARKMEIEIASDKFSKTLCDAYTRGVNTFISQLHYADYPLEYKIYSYRPELWSNYKTALVWKLFTYDWGAGEQDILQTSFMQTFGKDLYHMAFPNLTSMDMPAMSPAINGLPARAVPELASVPKNIIPDYYAKLPRVRPIKMPLEPQTPNMVSTWVLSPKKTASKTALMAVDVREHLSLPNTWHASQLYFGDVNLYAITQPGVPGAMLGFNESMAWSIAASNIDNRDYLHVRFTDASHTKYLFEGKIKDAKKVVEHYRVRGATDRVDTLVYTDMGVVFWDYKNTRNLQNEDAYVMRWKAAAPSNELKGLLLMSRAKNYVDYQQGLQYLRAPIMYVSYADTDGNVGVNLQGSVPLRWDGQGRFFYPGADMRYTWTKVVDYFSLPYLVNPPFGFAFAAGGIPFYQGDFPYYLSGMFNRYQNKRLYNNLQQLQAATHEDIERVLQDTYSLFSEACLPQLLRLLTDKDRADIAKTDEGAYLRELADWNFRYTADARAPTIFTIWLTELEALIWDDDMKLLNLGHKNYPPLVATLSLLQNAGLVYDFIDDRTTPEVQETLPELVRRAWEQAMIHVRRLSRQKHLTWQAYNQVALTHKLGLRSLGLTRTQAKNAGAQPPVSDAHITDAPSSAHASGSTWTMYVDLARPVRAFARSLGGPSGRVFSPFYLSAQKAWRDNQFRAITFYHERASASVIRQTMRFGAPQKHNILWHVF